MQPSEHTELLSDFKKREGVSAEGSEDSFHLVLCQPHF